MAAHASAPPLRYKVVYCMADRTEGEVVFATLEQAVYFASAVELAGGSFVVYVLA